jgi:AraC family transcriptional activator of pobA
MKKRLPVYSIRNFEQRSQEDFYANDLARHIKEHYFTNLPHKHDFYLVLLFTAGSGTHEIDFQNYPVKPGSLFIMQPGQMHLWQLSNDCEGYVFFHSRAFYESDSEKLQDYPFYQSYIHYPLILFKKDYLPPLAKLFEEINGEYRSNKIMRVQKLRTLVSLLYIEASREYKFMKSRGTIKYLEKMKRFEELVDQHYKNYHQANDYARLMNMTEKHLNRISQNSLSKTSTQFITEKIILEAQRLLVHSNLTVMQISEDLGFKDPSYFIRVFKKVTGQTPLQFLEKYRNH